MLSFFGEREYDAPYNDEHCRSPGKSSKIVWKPRKNASQLVLSDELALLQALNLNDACQSPGEVSSWDDVLRKRSDIDVQEEIYQFLSRLHESFKETFGIGYETEDTPLAWETRMPLSDDENYNSSSDESSWESWKKYGKSDTLPEDFVSQERFLAGSRFMIFPARDDSSWTFDDSSRASIKELLKEFGPLENPPTGFVSQGYNLPSPRFVIIRLPISWTYLDKPLKEFGESSNLPSDFVSQRDYLDALFSTFEATMSGPSDEAIFKEFGESKNLPSDFVCQADHLDLPRWMIIQRAESGSSNETLKAFGESQNLPAGFVSQGIYMDASEHQEEDSEEQSIAAQLFSLPWKLEVSGGENPESLKEFRMSQNLPEGFVSQNEYLDLSEHKEENPEQPTDTEDRVEEFGGENPEPSPKLLKEFGMAKSLPEDFVSQEGYLVPSFEEQDSKTSNNPFVFGMSKSLPEDFAFVRGSIMQGGTVNKSVPSARAA